VSGDATKQEREVVLHDLGHPDEEIRRLAVERVIGLPAAEALSHLVDKLGDESWRVRKAAVERLVGLGDGHPVEEALIAALADGENSGRRNSAFEALTVLGARTVPRLVEALASDDVDVRKLVVDALGSIGDPACTEALIARLRDEDPNVRAAAADALGVLGEADAVRALQASAGDDQEDPLVRLSSLRALARLEHPMSVSELGSVLDDSLLRPAAFSLLGLCGDDAALACLLKGLSLDSRASREAAMEALLRVLARSDGARAETITARIAETAASCDDVVESSIERLREGDLSARLTLIQFLGLTADPRCAIPVLEAGRDEAIAEVAHATLESMGETAVRAFEQGWTEMPQTVRADACLLMGRCGGETARQLLLATLDDADSTLRGAAALALGEMRCIDALPRLVRRLDHAASDEDPETEEELAALVEGLVALAPPDGPHASEHAGELVETLAARLEGAPERTRLAIATVLGRVGRVEDEELVASLLRDPSAHVRRAAVEALARLEPGAASEPLRLALADEAPHVRVAAAVALGHSASAAVIADLQRLLHDEDPRVSAAAVRSIGAQCRRENVGAEEAVGIIEHALRADGMVALAGIEALCMIGSPAAARSAVCVVDRAEPELVQAAIVCVGAHGDSDTVAELIPLVSHDSWSVRAEAIQTLADRRVGRAVPSILRRLETEQDAFVRDTILRALRQLED
jgi:HEAT repeat protein